MKILFLLTLTACSSVTTLTEASKVCYSGSLVSFESSNPDSRVKVVCKTN